MEAPDRRHAELYSLTPVLPELTSTIPMPVCIGIPWFKDFDPKWAGGKLYQRSDGTWWVPKKTILPIRGWHEVCLKPPSMPDVLAWWSWYDQLAEGACVGAAL